MQLHFSRFCSTVLLTIGAIGLLPAGSPGKADDPLPPETKALIAKLREDMKSKTVATRVTAHKAMGELGEKAKGQRRDLCQGMLDPNAMVRTAAADALKKVDEPMYKLALGIVIDRDNKDIEAAGKLGAAGEPLTPAVLSYATSLMPAASREKERTAVTYCIKTLVAIAPEDEGVNRAVVAMLGNSSRTLRALALDHVPPLKNKKLALKGVMALAATPTERAAVRIQAVNMLPTLTDENTTPATKKVLEALRFDNEQGVREAVAKVLENMK